MVIIRKCFRVWDKQRFRFDKYHKRKMVAGIKPMSVKVLLVPPILSQSLVVGVVLNLEKKNANLVFRARFYFLFVWGTV